MYIYKSTKTWSSGSEPPVHLIKKREQRAPLQNTEIYALFAVSACGQDFYLNNKKGILEEYRKEKHIKSLCKKCIAVVKSKRATHQAQTAAPAEPHGPR